MGSCRDKRERLLTFMFIGYPQWSKALRKLSIAIEIYKLKLDKD